MLQEVQRGTTRNEQRGKRYRGVKETKRSTSGKETRPIGIPTFEDKVLQRAVAMVLEPLYEQDFLNCSELARIHPEVLLG